MINDNAPVGATPLDPDEQEGCKHKHITTREQLDELEQVNIQQGLQWLQRYRQKDVLTDAFMRKLHIRLFGEVWSWAGTYRKTEKNIGIDPREIAVQLRMLLEDAQFWAANATYPPLEAAARFHHRLVSIHPFPNGNGRHARIATDVYLNKMFDHRPIEWAHGFDLQANNQRRIDYLAALRAADKGKYDLLFRFVGISG